MAAILRAARSLALLVGSGSAGSRATRLPGSCRWMPLAAFSSTPTPSSPSSDSPSQQGTWPVVVVGGGPTGLTTALLLQRYGVRCLLLERSPRLTDHPQAHLINHRTMEVFRGLSGLADEVQGAMPPLQQWRSFVYCTAMKGGLLGIVDHFPGQDTPLALHISPEPVAHLSQHRLVPLLARRAAQAPGVDLRMGHQVLTVDDDDGASLPSGGGAGQGVRLQVQPSGSERPYSVHAQYVVAADGAHSALRRRLAIPMEGPGAIQHLVNIHFVSPALGAALAGREGMLYFVFNAGVIAVVVAHNLAEGEFVAQVPYFPPLQTPEEFTKAVCAQLVRQAAGDPTLELEVRTVRAWTMSAAVARRYRTGRLLLAGDAAHVVPPSGAFGMNTGVQDAHNLAWKLAAVVAGGCPEALLDSYEAERKPVAQANMHLSVSNFQEALRVPQIMGLDFRAANLLNDALSWGPVAWAPTSLRRGLMDAAVVAGRAASGSIAALRRAELEEQFRSGATLRLQYPKEDLGFVYCSSAAAVKVEGGEERAAVAAYTAPKPRDAPFVPTTLPGARLPHFPVQVLRPGALQPPATGWPEEASSVDLPAAAGLQLVLLLSPSPALPQWAEAVQGVNCAAAGSGGVEIAPVVVVADAGQAEEVPQGMGVVWDRMGRWQQLREVDASGALLVRPDGHVGWRLRRAGGQVQAALARATAAVLAPASGHLDCL